MDDLIEDDAFLEALYDFIEEDEYLINQDSTKKVTRNRPDKIDYWTTNGGKCFWILIVVVNTRSKASYGRDGFERTEILLI